jgi:hypothetical protein
MTLEEYVKGRLSDPTVQFLLRWMLISKTNARLVSVTIPVYIGLTRIGNDGFDNSLKRVAYTTYLIVVAGKRTW